jgi:uncharacterized protein YbbC (DUF1343 family)
MTFRRECFVLPVLLAASFLASAELHETKSSSSVLHGPVLNGIDVLESEHFSTFKDLAQRRSGHLRVALMTNHSGLDANGRRTIDVLAEDATKEVNGFKLVNLFSPEHGINGVLDQSNIGNDVDPKTGLQVISLFGKTLEERHPKPEQFRDLDAVIIDLQDAGVRFYTYETVVGFFLETAAKTNTEVIILDRPNPINGIAVQGPMSTPGRENYINFMSEPIRQGLTMGELGTLFNGENHLNASLTVVRMKGWKRTDWFSDTGLMWTNPSPNLRSLAQAILYPGVGLLERTNLNVGRGTDTPFQWIGAPWIEGVKLAAYLNARNIPGVRFIPVHFKPGGKYPFHEQECQGVEMILTNPSALDSPELGLELASALYKLYPSVYEINKVDALLLQQDVLALIKAGTDPREVAKKWESDPALGKYRSLRTKYLLY